VLLQAPLTAAQTAEDQARVRQTLLTAKEYLVANRLERARTSGVEGIPAPNPARKAELAALAAMCALAPAHRILNLWLACKYMFQVKNLATVASLCRGILELAPRADAAVLAGKVDVEVVRKMLRKCEAETQDATPTGFKAGTDQCACAVTLKPIDNGAYAEGRDVLLCAFCGAKASMEVRGQVCPVCEVAVLGETGTGLQLY
jgi:coatomer protein complex subunit alpha (xenin)